MSYIIVAGGGFTTGSRTCSTACIIMLEAGEVGDGMLIQELWSAGQNLVIVGAGTIDNIVQCCSLTLRSGCEVNTIKNLLHSGYIFLQ